MPLRLNPEEQQRLFAKYGDLTGEGLVKPRIAQVRELVAPVAAARVVTQPGSDHGNKPTSSKAALEARLLQLSLRVEQLEGALMQRDNTHVGDLRPHPHDMSPLSLFQPPEMFGEQLVDPSQDPAPLPTMFFAAPQLVNSHSGGSNDGAVEAAGLAGLAL